MSIRKYERAIIRHRCIKRDGNAKAFPKEWKKYHDSKVKARVEQVQKDGRVTAIRTKPNMSKKHYDNGKLWLKELRFMKKMFENMKKQAENKRSEKQNNA